MEHKLQGRRSWICDTYRSADTGIAVPLLWTWLCASCSGWYMLLKHCFSVVTVETWLHDCWYFYVQWTLYWRHALCITSQFFCNNDLCIGCCFTFLKLECSLKPFYHPLQHLLFCKLWATLGRCTKFLTYAHPLLNAIWWF